MQPSVAVVVPCFDEEAAVGAVVARLRAALPDATVYVYDNASTDRTAEVARAAGAVVRSEPRRGKGNVVRRALADVDADIVLMIDGDDTYDADAAPLLVRTLLEGPYDQVTGVRREIHGDVHRRGHALGNRAFAWLVGRLFDTPTTDLFSGYRAFSRRFVRSFPGLSSGFEIETELTVHAARLRLPTAEVVTDFSERPDGGESKLRTVRDGSRILATIGRLLWHERPVLVHGVATGLFFAAALVLGLPVVAEFLDTGLVARLPTAVLATALVLLGTLVLALGLLLAAQKRTREEQARLWYLAQPAPPSAAEVPPAPGATPAYADVDAPGPNDAPTGAGPTGAGRGEFPADAAGNPPSTDGDRRRDDDSPEFPADTAGNSTAAEQPAAPERAS